MNEREEKKKRARQQARITRQKAEKKLEEELKTLQEATHGDLENLRPKIKDEATYDSLIAAVEKSRKENESIAEFKERLKDVGSNAIKIGEEAAKILKKGL